MRQPGRSPGAMHPWEGCLLPTHLPQPLGQERTALSRGGGNVLSRPVGAAGRAGAIEDAELKTAWFPTLLGWDTFNFPSPAVQTPLPHGTMKPANEMAPGHNPHLQQGTRGHSSEDAEASSSPARISAFSKPVSCTFKFWLKKWQKRC